jgi:arylsulfatase A-like enzyme
MPKPNVVLILVDDMGYGDFSAFNGGLSDTPVLDGLIEESVCLTQHYAGSCVCAPSRAALMSGRYPHRTGAIDTLDARGLDRLALRERTMGDMFQAAGYATGLVGKWHLGAADPRYHPNARGFDEFVGFRGGWWDYYDWTLDCDGSFREADGRYLTDVFTDEATGFIARHSDEPFFLHLTYNAPHGPFQAPQEDIDLFADRQGLNTGVRTLYGMIHRMDSGVGRVLEELQRQDIADNTIVLFTSDNGPQFGGEGDMRTHRFNCGFNGAKGLVYEGGIRLPMIVRWPDGLGGGRQVDDMVHFTDWLPTLAAAADVEMPNGEPLDGWNVWPVLRGEPGKVNTRRFWQWNRYTPVVESNAAMRDGEWKLVRPQIGAAHYLSPEEYALDRATKRDPESRTDICRDPEPVREIPEPPAPELYNIADDPEEQHNLAGEQPERAAKMLAELETWFEEVEAERATIDDEW